MAEPFEVQPLPPLYQQPSFAPVEPDKSPIADLGLSWEIGWEQMKGVPAWMQGAGASLLEKAGFEDAARSQRISARNLVGEMYQNIGELESLYSGPHSWAEAQEKGTAGSYAMWGINEAIKQVPNLATMALGALVSGGAMAPALLGRFAIARGMASIPMAAGNAQRGAQIAGVGLTSALLNTGEIYSSALLESGENNPAITGLAGLIAGSLDLWPGSKVIRAMGKDKNLGSFIANKFLADKKWRSRFYRALELGATEGFVEDIQTVIEAATINYLNSNDLSREYVDMAYGFIPITAEQVAERMEARAAGGLLGGLLGFPGRTVTKHAKKEDVKLNEEDMRELNDQLATVTVTVDGQVIGTYQEDFGVAPTPAPTPLTIGARGEGEFGITPERVARPYNAQRQKAALATVLEKYRAAKEKWEANPTDEAYQRDVQPLELEYYAAVMNDNELMFGVEEVLSYVTPEKLKTVQEYIQARKAIVSILTENPKLTERLKELRTSYTLSRNLERALGKEADSVATATMPYDGGMNPFATTPAKNIRGRVTSLDVPPVTRRRLAKWYANKTTQEAAEALEQSYGPEGVPDALAALETAFGPGKQPETRAQRKSRLTKEKKARERETKTLEAERIRAEEQSALMAGLYGGAPSGAAGIPTSVAQPTGPTMTVSYGMEEAAEQTVSEEAKDSPYTVVDVGRGPGTREYDLDQAMLIGMMLDDVRNFKIAEEQAALGDLQKSLLMKAYLALKEGYGYKDLKKILEKLGLSAGAKAPKFAITNAELGLPKGKPTTAALDEAIKNFIGKDLLFAEDMENAYSEMEMDQIVNSEKILSTLSRAQEGDERALFLLQKYGIPPDEAAIAARESIADARAEAVRRIERRDAALLKGKAARGMAEDLVTEEMKGRVADREELGLPPKQILKKKKPVLTGKKLKRAGILRARAMPSEEAGITLPGETPARLLTKKPPPIELGLAEPVTITYADVESELKRLAPESDSLIPWKSASTLPISDSEADNYLELEAAYTMIWNSFSVTEKGESIFLPTRVRRMGLRNWVIGPEGIYQNAKKALETLLPKGEDLYSLDYYKQQKFAPESALGKLLGDKTLGDIERDIGRRLAAKRKGVWGQADWETKITDAEIDAEVKKIVAFSPAGTYVLRQQPPRKKMMMFERGKDGNILLFNEDEVFKLDAKGNVVVYDEGGLKVGSYDPSSTIERGEGQPKIVLKELTKTERTQLPDRLIGYDKNDQLVEEQFVDDERNFKLVARLELLKNKYGLVKDIPMQELGRVASEFSIGSKFVGVVTRRGRATMMSLEALSVVKTEDVKGSIWFRVADKERTSQYLMLTDVGTRYQELMKIDGMSTDRAWEMSLGQEIETMQKMANIRYDQIIANNEQLLSNTRNDSGDLTAEEVKEANKELNDILEEEEAIFDAATIEKVIAFANENREFITDADNAKHMPSIPKGKEVQSTQVYNSLRNSASQGKRSFYIGTGIDETEDSFMARFSAAPRTPRVITKDTKVTLLPSAWKAIYEKDPFVQTLAKQVLRMKSLLGGKRTTEQENFKKIMLVPLGEEKRWDEGDVVKRYQLVDASERKFESAVELIVERESREGDPRSPTLWSDEDIKTMVEGIGGDLVFKNKKGEWVAPWEIDVKAWRERLERQYWEARHRYYETLNQQDLKTEAQRRRDQVTKLFKERSEAKEVTVSRQKKPANWKTMKKEEQQAWLEKAIQVSMMQDELILLDGFYHYKMMLETAIGNITSATYNVERSVPHIDKSGRAIGYDVITIQSERGPKFNVTEDQVVVVKLSQTALTRIQSNEIWKLQQKAKDVAKKGTINISSKLEKLRQVKVAVQEEINKELDAITQQENKEEITPAKAERDREKIRGTFTVRVFERLKHVTHDGKPFIALPKDLRKRVAAKELTYKQGVIQYIKSIRERFAETRLARVARLQREHLEDEDRLLIASLQTMDGKWRSKKVFEEGSKDYIKGFEEQVLGVSRDLHRPFRPKGIFKPKGWDLYKLLQDRYDDLVATRFARSAVRPERIGKLSIKIFEGKKLPAAWRAGRYWEFAKSAEYKDSADAWWTVLEEVYRKETEEVETFTLRKGATRAVDPFLPAQDFVGPLEARIPKGKEIGVRGGRIIEAAPRMRWKNAYGVIIDKISFRFIPSGSVKEEIWEMYEVIDPYLPENNQTFGTLKEATDAFGKVGYYRKLGEVAYPSPEQLGRFPKFPKRNLKPDTKGKAKPPVTNAAPVTTQQVMADNAKGQTVVVTVLSSDSNESKINVTETYQDVVPDVTGPKTRIYKPTEKRTTRKAPSLEVLGGQVVEDVGEVTPEGFAPGKAPKRIVKEGERLILDDRGRPMRDPETGYFMRYSFVLTGRYTDGEFPHTLSADENEGGSSRDSVVDRLNEAFGRQIFSLVHVVQSVGDLPLEYQMSAETYDPDIRGVTYNSKIYLVSDNLPINRIVPVTLHELGAHGMQAVMGKRFYQKLMAQVAVLVNTDPEMGALYDKLKAELGDVNEAIVLEEVMAYTVENEAMSDSTFWRAVVDAILYGLARLKLWLNPKWIGASDILIFAKAAARRHFHAVKDGDAKFTANFLNTFLYSGDLGKDRSTESDFGERLTSDLREKTGPGMEAGFRGNWFNIDVPLPEKWWQNFLMIRDVSRFPPAPGKRIRKLGKKQYQIYVAPSVVKWIADYFIILRSLEESIKARGGVITARNMPSLYHGAYKNIVNTRRKNFHRDMVIPFQNFLRDKKVNADDLHLYLYANHAKSRNEVHKGKAKASGVPVASGLFNTIAEAEAWNLANEKKYRSAEGIFQELIARNGGSENSQQWKDLQKAAEYIYKINNANLQMQIEEGMLNLDRLDDKQTRAYFHKEYQRTYVPLKGENIVVADEFFEEPLGPGKIGAGGPESKAVHGRVSEAENTWAWSIMQMDYEIDRVEKNKVVKAFARLINENKENFKDEEGRDTFATVVSLSDYKNHRDPFTKRLFLGLVEKQQTDPDHNIHFKSDGVEFVILVTDKRIGQAFNRTNMTDSGVFLQTTSMINRYFSAVHTSINPEFVITNFIRDFQTAMFNLQGVKETTAEFKDAEALGRKVFKDIKNAGVGLRHYIRDEMTDTEWSALAHEFSLEGGRIDFFAFKDVRDFEKKLKDYIKDSTAAGAKRWAKEMIGFIGDYNAVVENTMRLATYKNAKEAFIANGMEEGDAKRRAADIARNLTVNFSQKGEKGAALNSLYLFFNASVQGTVRLFQAMFQRPTGKKGFTRVQKIAGGIMMFSFTQAILNAMLAGDDEDGVNRYRQIDLRSRGRTAHIYLPGFDTFFKIPLPYGYNIFHAIGDTLASLMMGHTNPGRATMHVMSSAAESFMPFSFGSSDNLFRAGLKAASPTFADPLVDLALNESYFGQPIYKDPVWGSSDPPSERYWSSTGTIFKGVSRALNSIGGSKVEPGFVSIPPDVFEYLWESIGGGAARFVERTTDLVWSIGPMPGRITHRETGEVKWNKVPFARRFFYDETATRNRFVYDKYSEYEQAIKEATGLNTGILEVYGKGKHYDNFKESEDYNLFRLDDYRRRIVARITRYQKDRNKILKNPIMRNDVKENKINRLNDLMRDERMKLINKVDEIWE